MLFFRWKIINSVLAGCKYETLETKKLSSKIKPFEINH